MPKKKSKKPKKATTAASEDPVNESEESKKEVNDAVQRTEILESLKGSQSECLQELKLINEAQQSKAKLETFWAMAKQQREDVRMELRTKFRQRQDLVEKQQYEIKIYRQKVKHLLHEHQQEAGDQLIDEEIALTLNMNENRYLHASLIYL